MHSKNLPRSSAVYGLTAQYIEFLHDHGIGVVYGGNEPVGAGECIDRNLLESAPLQPFQSAFGVDAYPTIYDKAACLFFSIAGGHIFTNGNKRTSVLALEYFLIANAILLAIPNEEMVTLTRHTASHRSRGESPEAMKSTIALEIQENSAPFKELRVLERRGYMFWHKIKRDMRNQGFAVERSLLEHRTNR